MKLVRANYDKPHRCPNCHGVAARPRARWWRIYRCEKCGVSWLKLWHDYSRIVRWKERRAFRRRQWVMRAASPCKHIWDVVNRLEQKSSIEVMAEIGTPVSGKGLWPHDIERMAFRPVVVTRKCSICGTEEVIRV